MVNFLGAPLSNITGTEGSPAAPSVPAAPPPQINFLGAPLSNIQPQYGSPVPPPVPQYVDRQAWLRQELLRRQAVIQQAIQPLMQWQRIAEQRELQRQREMQEALSGIGVLHPATDPLTAAGYKGVDLARTRIPGAEQVADVAGALGERAGTSVGRLALGPFGVVPGTDIVPETMGKAVQFLAETAVPQEVWQAALELVPGIGTVPDLMRAAKAGAPDAVRAVRQALDTPAGQQAMRALREGESGQAPIPPVPESVGKLLARRGAKRTPEEAAQAWAALHPTARKLITSMADVVPSSAERRAILKAGRARQIAKSQEAVFATKGLPPDERARAISQALKGKIMPGIQPVRDRFTAEEADDIWHVMDSAVDRGRILGVEYNRAQSAMNLLFYGERIPGFPGPENLMPGEIKLLGRIYGPEFEAALPRTTTELSNWQKAVDVLSLPRAIQASLDFSAPGRQGLLLGVKNPDYWFQAWKRQFQAAFGGEEGFTRVANEIRSDPHFEDAVLRGVDFTDIGGGQTAEEAFVSHWVSKVPGVRASERAYVAFLDYLRIKSYGRGADRLRQTAQRYRWEPERLNSTLEQWAHFVNVASGRGDLGALNQFTPALNAAFFSPRFFVSRPQSIWQLVKPNADPAVRQMVFENLGAVFGLGATMLATLKMTGAAEVQMDPRSTDFGKIRLGDQRIDFWGGFQPLARYLAQISTRERVDPYARENVPVPAWDSVRKFIRSKLSPVGAVAWDFIIEGGRTYEGKEIIGDKPFENIANYAVDRVTPIGLQDIYEGYKEAGIPGAAVAGISLVGGSVQSYSPTERQSAIQGLEQAGVNVTYVDDRPQIRVPVLEKDWQNPKWQKLFADDFPELKAPASYSYVNELREAYVDHWWAEKGDESGVGESQRRRDLGSAFEKHDSIKKWRKNEELERLNYWKEHPDLLLTAVKAGLEQLSEDERAILTNAGLIE